MILAENASHGEMDFAYSIRSKLLDCLPTGNTAYGQCMKGVKNMIEQDTIRLLRECDEGVKMGISSIEDIGSTVTMDSLAFSARTEFNVATSTSIITKIATNFFIVFSSNIFL